MVDSDIYGLKRRLLVCTRDGFKVDKGLEGAGHLEGLILALDKEPRQGPVSLDHNVPYSVWPKIKADTKDLINYPQSIRND